jgi:hypothetical protein
LWTVIVTNQKYCSNWLYFLSKNKNFRHSDLHQNDGSFGYPNKVNKANKNLRNLQKLQEKFFISETEKHPFFPLLFQKVIA